MKKTCSATVIGLVVQSSAALKLKEATASTTVEDQNPGQTAHHTQIETNSPLADAEALENDSVMPEPIVDN